MGFQWDINWILIGYYWTINGKNWGLCGKPNAMNYPQVVGLWHWASNIELFYHKWPQMGIWWTTNLQLI